MKTLAKLMMPAILILPLFILFSCEEKNSIPEGYGQAVFSFDLAEKAGSAKGTVSEGSAMQLLISVEDFNGNVVVSDSLVPLYTFGSGYVTESLKMKAGSFRLTKLMVVNASGEVIYASPLKGSPMAYLVIKPLPLPFSITSDQVTKISTELLEVKDLTPDKFGYAAFGISIIKPVEFWTACIVDNPPLVMAPLKMTSARLTVLIPDVWKYTFQLADRLNHLKIRGGSDIYYFLVEKEGYLPQKFEFKAEQLMNSTENNPVILKIPYSAKLNVITLQPGPDKGKDAMISNLDPEKNFGDHRYFEATFLSEPVLTVMRSNSSLIAFNLDTVPKSAIIRKVILNLSYDLPIPFDQNIFRTTVVPGSAAWYGGVFQRITAPWDEHKVTWNNQPKTTEVNQVYLSPFVKNSNVIELDVTRLFVQPTAVSDAPVLAGENYGIMFRLWPSEKFPGFRFVSSDWEVPAMRPRLRIYYSL
jgi:hypothetical protein